jgi:glycosyltransferase involved in cell wall biosynthesis
VKVSVPEATAFDLVRYAPKIGGLERAMEFLFLNPEARKQIGDAARKKIEADLTWDAVAKKYLELFEEARRPLCGR